MIKEVRMCDKCGEQLEKDDPYVIVRINPGSSYPPNMSTTEKSDLCPSCAKRLAAWFEDQALPF